MLFDYYFLFTETNKDVEYNAFVAALHSEETLECDIFVTVLPFILACPLEEILNQHILSKYCSYKRGKMIYSCWNQDSI